MLPDLQNIFSSLSGEAGSESYLTLFESAGVKIERIVSRSHASPENFWYDQDQPEWVLVLQGEAVVEFENDRQITMQAGDYLLIPKHIRHRVARTSEKTVWLAVHAKS